MRLSSAIYTSIEHEVVNFMIDWDVRHYPLDPMALCQRMGIHLMPYSQLPPAAQDLAANISEDAFHIVDNRGVSPIYTIIYNDVADKRRIKFSIAHELGHIALGHSSCSKQNEAEANYFAGYLLAPDPLVIAWCDRLSADDVSDIFDVSYSCAKVASCHAVNRIYCGKAKAAHELFILKRFASKEVVRLGA